MKELVGNGFAACDIGLILFATLVAVDLQDMFEKPAIELDGHIAALPVPQLGFGGSGVRFDPGGDGAELDEFNEFMMSETADSDASGSD